MFKFILFPLPSGWGVFWGGAGGAGVLPHAEAELKFEALPEDEDQIVQLIENHEVNYITLNNTLLREGDYMWI